jgi:UDP-N-acetylglucosamine 2-epimerase (non-hydrolysing)
MTHRVLTVVGARPNFMKAAPVHIELEHSPFFDPCLVHTGQHYDKQMSEVFFRELELPQPGYHLGVGSASHAQQTAEIMVAFEKVIEREKPDLVIVVGDVNSTLACALVAAKCQVPVAHVEAGLRSFDHSMPEEINRILTDRVSRYLFATEESALRNLRAEGIPEDRIFLVGNVMIDSLILCRDRAEESPIVEELSLEPASYVVVTMHRPSNVDSPAALTRWLSGLQEVATEWPVVFPCHVRTRERLERSGWWGRLGVLPNFRLLEPLGYLDFLRLIECAGVVVTDSGGVQEETTYLQVPCLTLRENTERPVTVEIGTNELVSLKDRELVERVSALLRGERRTGAIPPLWDGRSAGRIVRVLEGELERIR